MEADGGGPPVPFFLLPLFFDPFCPIATQTAGNVESVESASIEKGAGLSLFQQKKQLVPEEEASQFGGGERDPAHGHGSFHQETCHETACVTVPPRMPPNAFEVPTEAQSVRVSHIINVICPDGRAHTKRPTPSSIPSMATSSNVTHSA
jgi:hypothetical protein